MKNVINMDITTKIKRSKLLYYVYYYVMSGLVNLYKLFLKPDGKLMLFVCFGGRHYSDSTRVIYEAMLKDERFKDYIIYWAFKNPEKYPFIPNTVNVNSLKYFNIALRARVWVTNVIVERALNFKGINTYYMHTTHGVLCKLDGKDAIDSANFRTLSTFKWDCCFASSDIEKYVYAGMFGIPIGKMHVIGMPKNAFFNVVFDVFVNLWKQNLGDDYVLLYRAHPVISSDTKQNNDFFIDVTNYEVVEDIMIASDLLVSDYSGIIFDYCIMDKPIFLWPYDYDKYNAIRGLYFDIRKELLYKEDQGELTKVIKEADFKKVVEEYVIPFKNKYETEYGNATSKALDLIYNNIQ